MRMMLARLFCPASHVITPREPTRDMTRAAAKAMAPGFRPTSAWVSNSAKHAIRYKAMIAAAEGK